MEANTKDVTRVMNIVGCNDDKAAIEQSRIVKGKPYPTDPSMIVISDPRIETRNGDLCKIVTVCRPRPPRTAEKATRLPAGV